MNIKTKLIFAAVVLLGAVGYLASAGMKSGWVYYLEVDKFVSDGQYHSQRVRLHGKVAADDFAANPGSLTANFKLSGHTQAISVVYRGQIPDQFQVGRDVVVEGKLDTTRVFKADVLLTKCASKYEANSPHAANPHAAVEAKP
jgi:cytochrome c-type biogenesis protein CcmE